MIIVQCGGVSEVNTQLAPADPDLQAVHANIWHVPFWVTLARLFLKRVDRGKGGKLYCMKWFGSRSFLS